MTLSLERVSVNYWPDTQIPVPASNLKKDSACAAVQIAAARRLPTGRVEEVTKQISPLLRFGPYGPPPATVRVVRPTSLCHQRLAVQWKREDFSRQKRSLAMNRFFIYYRGE
jgi:hypothetical protein